MTGRRAQEPAKEPAMSRVAAADRSKCRGYRHGRRLTGDIASLALGVALLIWTLLPVYNMVLISLDEEGDEFTGSLWPPDPSFGSFRAIWTQDHWYLEHFWHQFGNSLFVGVATMALTVVIGSLASFAIGRMQLRRGQLIGDAALLTYILPTAILIIPFAHLMHAYGLSDSLWAVIAAYVAFAAPYAVLILHQYGKLLPMEFDECAKIDGASPVQIYLRIYLPLMTPALVTVGIYALLLAWNDYLYQFVLLSSTRNMTVAAAIDQFFDSDEAPWNYMMAVALVYSLPPVAIYFALRRFMSFDRTHT
ncbi:MAG: carbohydrate ABC transporter permease [Bradyrhizobium sp.]|nr:carbohydrate ABC transporter permease [Bradyrhizobium sp.]